MNAKVISFPDLYTKCSN